MNSLSIRMYNVGFGDCFLLRIVESGKTSKVLFDCGSIAENGQPIKSVVDQVIRDTQDSPGPAGQSSIDVVIATHRHKDHVSGFADPRWKNVAVKEVWMPWTEDPDDADARKIRQVQSKLAAALDGVFQRRRLDSSLSAVDRERIDSFSLLATNALSNETAMSTLHDGFAGEPHKLFLPSKGAVHQTIVTQALPGVIVHVMGPSRDPEVIRDMDPPDGESYLRMLDPALGRSPVPPDTFPPKWWIDQGQVLQTSFSLSLDEQKQIQNLDSGMEEAVTTSLDKAVNGTSLMLMFQIGEQYLLFPGDAQWGTWQAVLKDPHWRDLLQKTSFYKVGHHGSHNATPRDFVQDLIPADLWGMASTMKTDKWPNIPKPELLAALLARKATIERSDEDTPPLVKPFTGKTGVFVDIDLSI